MGRVRSINADWDTAGVENAVKAALAMELPSQVILKGVKRLALPDRFAFQWVVHFQMPHMAQAAFINVEQPNYTPFPYDEVLTKIRVFFP